MAKLKGTCKCQHCKEPVRRKRLAQRYCSKACRDAARNQITRKKRVRLAPEKGALQASKRRLVPIHLEARNDPEISKEIQYIAEAKIGTYPHVRIPVGRYAIGSRWGNPNPLPPDAYDTYPKAAMEEFERSRQEAVEAIRSKAGVRTLAGRPKAHTEEPRLFTHAYDKSKQQWVSKPTPRATIYPDNYPELPAFLDRRTKLARDIAA